MEDGGGRRGREQRRRSDQGDGDGGGNDDQLMGDVESPLTTKITRNTLGKWESTPYPAFKGLWIKGDDRYRGRRLRGTVPRILVPQDDVGAESREAPRRV
mmetsp:Transcript_32252/g.32538  ORF Transcript_32252/g.32538 Transcript_32252/m.32538 type:complete len:100 (-) Transcript_32252:1379-1678(-)